MGIFTHALAASAEIPSVSVGFWDTLKTAYFGEYPEYANLNLSALGTISLRLIVVGIFLGLAFGGFVAAYNKQVLGRFVRLLLKEECLSPESGKTLPELNYADKLMIRRAVRKSLSLRRVVRCAEEETYLQEFEKKKKSKKKTPDFCVDPDAHHFYIPEEMKYMADIKFEGKGNSWRAAVWTAVGMILLMLIVLAALPFLLSLLNDFLATFNTDAV